MIKFHGWEKKPRTALRFIKAGDVFMFKLTCKEAWGLGRIMTDTPIGKIVEVFDICLDSPEFHKNIDELKRIVPPFILDSYMMFDRKRQGDWRIVGHQNDYVPRDIENIFFVGGAKNHHFLVDFFGNTKKISNEEAKKYPTESPCLEYAVQPAFTEKYGK